MDSEARNTQDDTEGPSTAQGPGEAQCPNCETVTVGSFCHACGQRQRDSRLTMRELWRDFAIRFLSMENGFLLTMKRLFRNPGDLARSYVDGQRKRHVNPVSVLLVMSAFSLLMLPLYMNSSGMSGDAGFADMFEQGVRMSGANPDEMEPEERAEMLEFMRVYTEQLFIVMGKLNSVFSLLLAFVLAVTLRLFLNDRDASFSLAETMVMTLYVVGAYLFFVSLLSFIAMWIGGPLLQAAVAIAALLLMVSYGAVRFYRRPGIRTVAYASLAGAMAWVVYLILVVVVSVPVALWTAMRTLRT